MLIPLTVKNTLKDKTYTVGVETTNVIKMTPNNYNSSKPETYIEFNNNTALTVQESLEHIFKKLNIQHVRNNNSETTDKD